MFAVSPWPEPPQNASSMLGSFQGFRHDNLDMACFGYLRLITTLYNLLNISETWSLRLTSSNDVVFVKLSSQRFWLIYVIVELDSYTYLSYFGFFYCLLWWELRVDDAGNPFRHNPPLVYSVGTYYIGTLWRLEEKVSKKGDSISNCINNPSPFFGCFLISHFR